VRLRNHRDKGATPGRGGNQASRCCCGKENGQAELNTSLLLAMAQGLGGQVPATLGQIVPAYDLVAQMLVKRPKPVRFRIGHHRKFSECLLAGQDQGAAEAKGYGFGCRGYSENGHTAGRPAIAQIRSALRSMKESE